MYQRGITSFQIHVQMYLTDLKAGHSTRAAERVAMDACTNAHSPPPSLSPRLSLTF